MYAYSYYGWVYKIVFTLSDSTTQTVENTEPGFTPPANPATLTYTIPAG